MSEIKAYTPGIYPCTEELTQTAGPEPGSGERARRAADLRTLPDIQREADLDYISDGLLDWQDIFQPLEAAAEGLGSNAPTLPSPHAPAEQARIEPRVAAERVIGPQIRWLAENAYMVLQETALFASEIDLYPLSEAIDVLASPLPPGNAGNLLGELVEIEVHAIGVDLFATEVEALRRPFPKTLLAGIVDARNPLLDEMDEGRELHLVPDPTSREKVLRLGAATMLKDENIEEGAVT